MNKFISDLIYYHDLQAYNWLKNSVHWSFLNTESSIYKASSHAIALCFDADE